MSDTNAKVVAMVERALKKDAEVKSTDLRDRAIRIDDSVAELSGRQFHARYVIQVRKRLFGGGSSKRSSAKKRKRKARASAPAASGSSFLLAAFERKKAELDTAIDGAFQRAMAADSAAQIDKLLATIDQHTHELEHV